MRQNGSARKKIKRMAEINVVPYIDVMLVLLIIFMVTAPLLTQGVHVNLPSVSAKPLPPDKTKPLIVTVDSVGRLYLNTDHNSKVPLSEEEMIQQLKSSRKDDQQKIFVRGDQAAQYGAIMSAMVVLQNAGFNEVGLITERPQQKDKKG